MDLRGEKDVIGWSSLPAVERDAAQHLQHRATERKRCRPSARKRLVSSSPPLNSRELFMLGRDNDYSSHHE